MAIMRTNDRSCSELVNALLSACTNTLTSVGLTWKQRWDGSLYEILATEYGLSGLPMELVMYEWPRSVLSLWQRAPVNSKLNDSNELTHATPFPPTAPALVAYKLAAAYGNGLSEVKSMQNSDSQQQKISNIDSEVFKSDYASTNISEFSAADELDWLELFNLSDYGKESFENSNEVSTNPIIYPPNTKVAASRFSANCASSSQRDCKYQTLVTATQLSGLFETEPLTFTIICASDHVKMENSETGTVTEIGCTLAPIGHTENEGSVPLKIMDISRTISNEIPSYVVGNDSVSRKPGLQDLSADLNARMTLIAMEQAETKEGSAVGNSDHNMQTSKTTTAGNVDTVPQGFATQGSSASTFGIPTTPKTTPFMTPTPLSPSHLSPTNSGPDLDYVMETEPTNLMLFHVVSHNLNEGLHENNSRGNDLRSQIPSFIPAFSTETFKMPSQKVLLMERVSFGSKKFVILDFGAPVLLTDFFIPSVAELAAISINVWLLGENVDGQRLLMTTDICRRSIAIQDLQPLMRIRFMKITYVGRQLHNSCKIPIGMFFGHRYFSSWQIHSSPFMQKEYFTHYSSNNQIQQRKTAAIVNQLRQLCEDLRCRHQLANAELRRLVNEFAREDEVKQIYRECAEISLQWNVVVRLVHRLELDHVLSCDSDQSLENVLYGNWDNCCPDQLQTIAVELFALITQATHLIDVRAIAVETFASDHKLVDQSCHPSEAKYARLKSKKAQRIIVTPSFTEDVVLQPKFNLDNAVTFFVLFCIPAVPKLQVGCITWLFYHGSECDWWPLFFPRVLKEILSAQFKKNDHRYGAAIILELFNLINEVANSVLNYETVKYHSQPKLNVTLLCWSLMLVSSAFDVVASSKKKSDRWTFIGGESSRKTSNEHDSSSLKVHKKKGHKFGNGNEKQPELVKNSNSKTLKTELDSLWDKHFKVMEAMKAAKMKMSKALSAKIQKKIEVGKKVNSSPPHKMSSAPAASDKTVELTQLENKLLAFFAEEEAEEIMNEYYLAPAQANDLGSVDSSESALKKAISGANKNHSRSCRSRRYNIRLKLPVQSCAEVTKNLASLLCNFNQEIPILPKLLICKIVARICIGVSHHTIPLVYVLEGQIDKFIRIGLEEHRTGLLKYAILHSILDVIESESRAIAKSSVSSEKQIKKEGDSILEVEEELDVLCMRYTGCHFVDLAFQAKSKNDASEDVEGRKSTGITAIVCCLPDVFSSAKTSPAFSIANYDEQPELGSEQLDLLISQALFNTRQAVIPNGPSDEIRIHTYRTKAREIIKEKLSKGEKFYYLFRWIDDLLEIEEQAARSCNGDPETYVKMLNSQILPSSSYEELTTVSKSAFLACCLSEYLYSMNDQRCEESVHGFGSCSPVTGPRSSSPSSSGSPRSHTDVEMKESETKSMRSGEAIKMSKNLDDFANLISHSITEALSSPSDYNLLEAQSSKVSTSAASPSAEEQCSSATSSLSKSKIRRAIEKWVPTKWMAKIALNKEEYMEHIMASFLSELRLTKNNVLVQPCSFSYAEFLGQQLGLSQHICCMNIDFLADLITRYSVRDLSKWKVCLPPKLQLSDNEIVRKQIGGTLKAANIALGRFIESISSSDSVEFVQRLLNFCLDFDSGLIHATRKLPTTNHHCVLPANCITSVVNYAVMSNSLPEHMWAVVLKILDLIMKNNIGPSTVNAFKNFSRRLHETSDIALRSVLCVKILSILRHISSEQSDLINFFYPNDCLVELLSIMLNYTDDYASVAPQELASYISSSIHAACNFINQFKASKGCITLISADSYYRPNVCFQITLKNGTNENGDAWPQQSEMLGHYGALWAHQHLDSKRSAAPGSESSSSCPWLSRRQYQSNIFCEIARYMDRSTKVSDYLVRNFPAAIEKLFEIVASCESAVPDINLISMENWTCVTLGDHALFILLKISQETLETKLFCEIAVRAINQCTNPLSSSISKPLAFAFVQVLKHKYNQAWFARLGGHLIVARELERSILSSANDWTAPVTASLMRQLASLSAQVAGSSNQGWPTSKLLADGRVDALQNYAPYCKRAISSDRAPNVCGQLSSLIGIAVPRRTRSANWSYHFTEGGGEWFDITLTLPHHIILHEIQIRPHVPALSTAPAAVHLELCSDASLNQWCNVGAPLNTTGYSKIRISTESFKLPVIAVRLYLKKPLDSPNLSLSQILLFGMDFTSSLSRTCTKNTDFVQWLSIMVQLCNFKKRFIWQCAPELPRAVIALFLGRPLSCLIYYRVTELLNHLDDEQEELHSVINLVFHYTGQGNIVTNESLEWLPDLLFTLCARKSTRQADHEISIIKQGQLLRGVVSFITSQNCKKSSRDVIAVLIWTASCVIWHNINVEERRFATLAICMDLAPHLLPFLCEMSVDTSEHCNDTLAKSASWMLCSLVRGAPYLLGTVLKEIGLLDGNNKPTKDNITHDAFCVVQRMCQSKTAISKLHSFGLFENWIELIITYSEEASMAHMSLLVSMVRCIASLCCIEDVVKSLDSIGGFRFFNSLIKCVVRCTSLPGDMVRSSNKQSIKLEEATISLLSQCITVNGAHRERIAHVLCSLLKSIGSLNSAIQQMVLKCIFDDEVLPVKVVDEDNTSICFLSFDIPNRILHPFFGCTRRERFLKVSLYTSLDEITALSEHKNSTDLHQLGKLPASALDSPQLSSVLNNEAKLPHPFSRLTLKNGDGVTHMEGSWKVGQLLGDLFTSGRLTCSAWKLKMEGKDVLRSLIGDSADGFYTLVLSFVVRSARFTQDSLEPKTTSYEKPKITLTEQTSTLQYFARANGLALLAQHLQLHHPTANTPPATSSSSKAARKPADQPWLMEIPDSFAAAELVPHCYACPTSIFSSESATGEPVYSSLYVPVFGGETDHNYEDFEYIETVASADAKGWTYYPLFSQTDNFGNYVLPKKSRRDISQQNNRVLPTGLSSYVIVAFSIFLKLEGYAELLVTYDRGRAKNLLRLAMGVVTHETSAVRKSNIFHKIVHFKSQSDQKSDHENLGSLPFLVLEQLFNKFSTDTLAGKSLREDAITFGVLDVLLDCLAHYTHQKHKEETIRPMSFPPAPEAAVLFRKLLQGSMETEPLQNERTNHGKTRGERVNSFGSSESTVGPTSTAQHSFWAKGTGFGSGTTQQQWNVDLHVMKRKQDEQNVTYLLRVLSSFIHPKISEYLKMQLTTASVINHSIFAPLTSLDSNDMEFCVQNTDVMLPSLHSDSSVQDLSEEVTPIVSSSFRDWSLNSAIVKMISRSCLLPTIKAYLRNDSGVKEVPESSPSDEKDAITDEEKYIKVMKKLQFETIPFFAENSFIPYHYESSLTSVGTSSSLGKRTRRLAQEIVTLSNSLPLSSSSSVFVRACEERLDVMKVLITGPADTPYMNGCFEFDVWFPSDYPNSPMHVNLETTGNHTVRFNPNLYNDGKVCLSVLNTWHGRPEERWNPETSSLLQVIVSIQSLIFVSEPYFNEPGYERSKCTQAGQQASRDYDANIRQAVIKWAILEMIRHPPVAFTDILRKHFWLKRNEIQSQVSKWISEMEQSVRQQRGNGRSLHGHLASMKRHAAALDDEFRRMECPADLIVNESLNLQTESNSSEDQNNAELPLPNYDFIQEPLEDSLEKSSAMEIPKL
ncbi:unnamed protein product [Thelazia callipaeda]|uniref:UBIQUITIN_CONJUGAT_2 domain-containing protein n=1 Tax=Thelazia callipaeda TaxID=103827 RepID=A0A0N5CU68_THECL|nr:unnamed protein product [Thelazia callipaeda]